MSGPFAQQSPAAFSPFAASTIGAFPGGLPSQAYAQSFGANPFAGFGASPFGGSQTPVGQPLFPQIVQTLQIVPQQLQQLLHLAQIQQHQVQYLLQVIPQQLQQLQHFLAQSGFQSFTPHQPFMIQPFSAQQGLAQSGYLM